MSADFLVRDTREPGHFWADNGIYDVFGPRLGAYGFAVYMALCRKATNGTGECRIAMSEIARALAVSKATVHKALSTITDLGLARVESPGGPKTVAVYVLANIKSSVRIANAEIEVQRSPGERSVRIANAYKERRLSSRLKSKSKSKTTSSEPDDGALKVFDLYRSNPLTHGDADLASARKLLARYSLEQIEAGILLASARRLSSGITAKIRSMVYFEQAIEEAANDKALTPTYIEYLRRTLAKLTQSAQIGDVGFSSPKGV